MRFDYVLFVVVLGYAGVCQGIQCGMSKINTEQFKIVITECIKDNETLTKIFDLSSTVSTEEEDETSMSSDEDLPAPSPTRASANSSGNNQSNNRNVKLVRTRRSTRSKASTKNINSSNQDNQQPRFGTGIGTSTDRSTSMEDQEEANVTENNVGDDPDDEMCTLKCIFEKLQMTDSSGFPDHKKIASALISSASGRQVTDFMQETADECFQESEQSNTTNTCEFSSKLFMCLAEKGRSNCEDWPAGNLPF